MVDHGPRTLVVARHAKAAWPDDVADHERPLTGRGRRDSAVLGGWLVARGLLPDVVICSSALRAAQTWAAAGAAVTKAGAKPRLETVDDVYDAPASRLLALVRGLAEGHGSAGHTGTALVSADPGCVLLVGHNPGVEELVSRLSGMSLHLRTAGVAVLAVATGWAGIEAADLAETATCRAG